ncbi:MAG: putative Multi-sensor hybrid histidine kinase, partial [Nitrospira sp.]|nr:putative Multi-sensor hybrid histidine kinase [Nitrospira sp.]
MLHEFGLLAALPWLAEQMKRYDLTVAVEVPQNEDLQLPADRLVLIFQSVRELLMNAAKHAHIDRVTVTLKWRDRELRIEVQDRGRGFDPAVLGAAAQPASTRGFGLFSIRERMLALDGRLEVMASPGRGTKATDPSPLVTGAAGWRGRCARDASDEGPECRSFPPGSGERAGHDGTDAAPTTDSS